VKLSDLIQLGPLPGDSVLPPNPPAPSRPTIPPPTCGTLPPALDSVLSALGNLGRPGR